MKIRAEYLVATVRMLTGAFAFLLWILIGSLLFTDPIMLVLVGLLVFVAFHIAGGVFAKLLERTNYEITDIERDHAGDEEAREHRQMGRLLDISQSAELPYGD